MSKPVISIIAVAALAVGITACGGSSDSGSGTGTSSGSVTVDGSSTVFPFAQAAAEAFQSANPNAKVTVGESGTGGGFEKFCAGETDISDASRPIDPAKEVPVCKKNGITYTSVQVANDGISIVTNPSLKITCLKTAQLNQLWKKGSTVTDYSQLGSGTPAGKVSLYGPGTNSGTFDFFTETINGTKGDSRTDYQPSEDDNVLVQGVEGDQTALGYFGYSYYESNASKLNLVAVDGGGGCIKPSVATIQNGTYKPLSRPLYVYVNTKALSSKPQVKAFIDYELANAEASAKTAQIVPLTPDQLSQAQAALKKAEGS